MTEKEVRDLDLGLYRIHWKSGLTSLCAVGHDSEKHWYMSPNWTANELSYEWLTIESMELLLSAADDGVVESIEYKRHTGQDRIMTELESIKSEITTELDFIKDEQRAGQDNIVSYMEKKFDKLGSQITQIFTALDRLEVDKKIISSESDDRHEATVGKFDMIFDDIAAIYNRIAKMEDKPQSPPTITEEEMKILDEALQIKLKHSIT